MDHVGHMPVVPLNVHQVPGSVPAGAGYQSHVVFSSVQRGDHVERFAHSTVRLVQGRHKVRKAFMTVCEKCTSSIVWRVWCGVVWCGVVGCQVSESHQAYTNSTTGIEKVALERQLDHQARKVRAHSLMSTTRVTE